MSALFSPAPSRIFISYSRNFNFIKGNWGEVEAKTRREEKRNSRARHRTRELCSDSIFIEQTSSECEQRKNTMTSSFFISISTWIVKWAVTHFPKPLCFFFHRNTHIIIDVNDVCAIAIWTMNSLGQAYRMPNSDFHSTFRTWLILWFFGAQFEPQRDAYLD